ncbi:hypothetical protein DPM19_15405 [Actinomadura craniellae]|uniref:DUF2269 domain-containing protein n=1 Tax=Actinomadura craniellae TaxID=2231787 RepID=A0A365H5I4_9ACTN|nr:DUF2269 family protein [Actinomadura craniellae]RAY14351.1 hypothetical protein DPM19_15405 [Actinomadura craniellae]
MSLLDRLLLILHIGFAIFTLGPLTAATSATPRYIRRRDARVLRYLNRATDLYAVCTLGILLFGLILAGGNVTRGWLAASIALYVVALVLLLLVDRDQRRAIQLVEAAAEADAARPAESVGTADVAPVERGRIAVLSGVVALLWVVILVLMVGYGGR